jgi:N-acetylneuraminate lyase
LIPAQCEHLLAQGVGAAFVCGTTGEGTSLTREERWHVAEAWVRASRGRLRVIVHVGHLSAASARELAAHAQEIGAHAFSSCCPSFFPITSAGQLAELAAATAVGAPRLPFYFYHIPAFTGVQVSMVDFLVAAAPQIPNLRGVKFTHEDLEQFVRLLRHEGGRFDVLSGREQMLLAALASGGRGAIGSSFNLAAPVYAQLWREFDQGELEAARNTQAHAIALTVILRRYGGLAAGKAAMAAIGLECGPVRPPLRTLSPGEQDSLRAELAAWTRTGPALIPAPSGVNGTDPARQHEAGVEETGSRITSFEPV